MKLIWKLAIPQTCIVILLGLISFAVINPSFVIMRERYVKDAIENRFQRMIKDIEISARASAIQASFIVDMPVVARAYEIALSGDIDDPYSPQSQAARELLRKEFARMMESHKAVTGHKPQIHFQLRNGFSLARLWRDKQTRVNGEWVDLSDDLRSFRHTVMEVLRTGKTVMGLEPGSGGFAIRGVIPVKGPDGSLLGSAEVLQDFDDMLSAAADVGKMYFALYANKELLDFSVALQDAAKHPTIGDFVRVTKVDDGLVESLITPELLSKGKRGSFFENYGAVALAAYPFVDYSGKQVGVMVCAMNTEAISDFAHTSGITLALMLVGMAVMPSTVLLLCLRALVTRPLGMIKTKIQEIAQDQADLSEKIPADQKDEIGELAGWFNRLTAKLAAILDEKDEVIAKNVEMKSLLAKEKDFFQTTVNSIGDAVITMGPDGVVITMNDTAEAITGFPKPYAIGKHYSRIFALLHETNRTQFECPIEQNLKEDLAAASDAYLVRTGNGNEKHIAFNCSPLRGAGGVAQGAVLVFRDISASKEKTKKMEYLSYHDCLTGLYNRAFFEQTCAALEMERIVPISIIMGDANGLKYANDVYGHGAGDMLLQTIANAFKTACRSNDIVARWGGDEFIAILPGLSRKRAKSIIKQIHKSCAAAVTWPVKASVALGMATKESPETPFAEALSAAETAMYKAKQASKQLLRRR